MGRLAGLLEYSEDDLVSTDIVGSSASCIFDSKLTMAQGNLVKVLGWYDNETGYSSRLVDLATVVGRGGALIVDLVPARPVAPRSSRRPRRRRSLGEVHAGDDAVIDLDGLDRLIALLVARGYRTIGPVARDGAIVHGEVAGAGDLPAGWHDIQAPGRYRLEQAGDPELFGWAVGPASWKSEFFQPAETVWRASVTRRRAVRASAAAPRTGRWPSSAPGPANWRRWTCSTASSPAARSPTTATRPAGPER